MWGKRHCRLLNLLEHICNPMSMYRCVFTWWLRIQEMPCTYTFLFRTSLLKCRVL